MRRGRRRNYLETNNHSLNGFREQDLLGHDLPTELVADEREREERSEGRRGDRRPERQLDGEEERRRQTGDLVPLSVPLCRESLPLERHVRQVRMRLVEAVDDHHEDRDEQVEDHRARVDGEDEIPPPPTVAPLR